MASSWSRKEEVLAARWQIVAHVAVEAGQAVRLQDERSEAFDIVFGH